MTNDVFNRPFINLYIYKGSNGTPMYDNSEYTRPGVDIPDMLVRNTHLGAALASKFTTSTNPEHVVVLMRGHGMTVIGPTIQDAVLRAVYTQNNASIQTTALLTRVAYRAELAHGEEMSQGIRYLNEEETEAAMEMTRWSALRPWSLWLREVEAQGLYVNRG
jgi:hypothetical protein